jgi:hypothetical protein
MNVSYARYNANAPVAIPRPGNVPFHLKPALLNGPVYRHASLSLSSAKHPLPTYHKVTYCLAHGSALSAGGGPPCPKNQFFSHCSSATGFSPFGRSPPGFHIAASPAAFQSCRLNPVMLATRLPVARSIRPSICAWVGILLGEASKRRLTSAQSSLEFLMSAMSAVLGE